MKANTLEHQYRERLSNYREWETDHEEAIDALVFPKNFGTHMSIDDVYLAGEYYTCITNKAGKGRKGTLAALIKGTNNKSVSEALEQVPVKARYGVEEITLDFANSMDWICRSNFPNARKVGDRFHSQQMVTDAVQEVRIALRRKATDEENEALAAEREQAKKAKRKPAYKAPRYSNGETKKELLARSRYLLYKPRERCSESQQERAEILFEEFPKLQEAYHLYVDFRTIYEGKYTQEEARKEFAIWRKKAKASGIAQLISAANSVKAHEGKIVNYFPERATNASAESFNAKMKGLRNIVRGIKSRSFFLYRICTLYA